MLFSRCVNGGMPTLLTMFVPCQVDPYFMDSEGEEEDAQPSPDQRHAHRAAQAAQQLAAPAASAGEDREAGGAAVAPAGEALLEKYRAELANGKRKVPQGEKLGECGAMQ
jgi:hypothetical protein